MALLGGNRARADFQLMPPPLGRSIFVRGVVDWLSDDARRRTALPSWSAMVCAGVGVTRRSRVESNQMDCSRRGGAREGCGV